MTNTSHRISYLIVEEQRDMQLRGLFRLIKHYCGLCVAAQSWNYPCQNSRRAPTQPHHPYKLPELQPTTLRYMMNESFYFVLIQRYIIRMNSIKKIQAQKIKSIGDVPTARFGHTFNILGQERAVLFGGAVPDGNKYIITNDTYIYELSTKRWRKVNNAKGEIPAERAAHSATAISPYELAVYGGAASNQQGLLKDDLYILDLKNPAEPIWKQFPISNKEETPGTRYGHILVFAKPYLIVFGGNTGSKTENDVWIINISKVPSSWMKCSFDSNKPAPCPRVYHSAALCTEGRGAGMIVIYGGRKETKSKQDQKDAALNDVWGLMRHSNGQWDWMQPPKSSNYTPIARYQHLVTFIGSYLVIFGGRSNPPDQNPSYAEVYDMQESTWTRMVINTMFEPVRRHRHAGFVLGGNLVIHGGFGPDNTSQPSQALLSCNLSALFDGKEETQNSNVNIPQVSSRMGISRQLLMEPLRQEDRNAVSNNAKIVAKTKERDLTPTRMLTSARAIKLSNQVLVAKDDFNRMKIQRVHVNNLLEESKRLTIQPKCEDVIGEEYEIADEFLAALLPGPGQSRVNTNLFPFQREKIMKLCKDTSKQLETLPASVVYLRAPIKVFGSIYGRYYQLLRLFESFGVPDEREMETFTYVFLGNYVDKGFNSLETICLLMALKLKYPDHIVLLRGAHEDPIVNKVYGFAEECSIRLNENVFEVNSIYTNINKMFELLPMAAVIEDKILCVHSSIGPAASLQDIENIPRPLKLGEDKRALGMIWPGLESPFYGNIPEPSPQQITKFLESHDLSTIIRSHQSLMDGVMSEGNTISIFSVANYGKLGNHSSILKITKNLSIVNQVLQPVTSLRGGWLLDQNPKTSILFTEQELSLRKRMFSQPRKK